MCPLLRAARVSISSLQLSVSSRALKAATTKMINDYHTKIWDAQLERLKVQSKFQDIIADCPSRNRIISGLPSGQLSFLLRAGSDTLPTPLNLARWRIQTDPRCPLCNSQRPTILHILNGCPVALNQGRYTWRHDSVLAYIVSFLSPLLDDDQTLYADLPGHRASDAPLATIPTNIISTSSRPDLVLHCGSEINLLELTVCSNTVEGFSGARARKQSKQVYIELVGDLEASGYSTTYDTIEIGSLGHCTPATRKALNSFVQGCLSKSQSALLFRNLARTAISCSYSIYISRDQSDWNLNKQLFCLY